MKNICLIVCKLQVTHKLHKLQVTHIAGAHAAYIVATGATYGSFRSQGLTVL